MFQANEVILFKERQRFKQWWIWLFIVAIDIIVAYALISQLFFDRPVGNNPATNGQLIVIAFFVLLLNVFFLITRLETIITDRNIYFKFIPFHLKWKKIAKEDIESIELKSYNPLRDFGGWGLKYNIGSRIRAYSVSGNMGVFIELKNKERLMLGTRRIMLIEEALDKFKSLN